MPSRTRSEQVNPTDINRMDTIEVRVFAYLAAAAAARRPATIRDLAMIGGPTGRAIGARTAMLTARDLVDAGLLGTVPALVAAGLDGPLTVTVAGCTAPPRERDSPVARTAAAPRVPPPTGERPPRAPAAGPAFIPPAPPPEGAAPAAHPTHAGMPAQRPGGTAGDTRDPARDFTRDPARDPTRHGTGDATERPADGPAGDPATSGTASHTTSRTTSQTTSETTDDTTGETMGETGGRTTIAGPAERSAETLDDSLPECAAESPAGSPAEGSAEGLAEGPAEGVADDAPGVPATRAAAPSATVGRMGPLLVPRSLPDELRGELVALGKEYRAYQRRRVSDLAVLVELAARKAAALRAWAELPEPLSFDLVRSEAARAAAGVESIREQLANQQDRTRVLTVAAAPVVSDDDVMPDHPEPVQGLGVPVRAALAHLAATRPGNAPASRLLALVCLLRAARGSVANLTGMDLRSICGAEAEAAARDLAGTGWLVVDADTLAGAGDEPVKCGVPATENFTLGKLPRTRSSGWVSRAIAHKKLKKKPAAVRLAALCAAAHSDPAGWVAVDVELLTAVTATGADDVPELVAALEEVNWLGGATVTDGVLRGRVPFDQLIFVDALRSSTPVQTIQNARKAAAAAAAAEGAGPDAPPAKG